MSEKDFKMANANDPMDIIKATQESCIDGLRGIFSDLEKENLQTGLTWKQLDQLLLAYKDKQPTVIFQKETQ